MSKPSDALVGRKIAVGVRFATVTIEVICGGDYEAQVLYDDVVERLQSGDGVSLSVKPAGPNRFCPRGRRGAP